MNAMIQALPRETAAAVNHDNCAALAAHNERGCK